jgi:hypothetical protein
MGSTAYVSTGSIERNVRRFAEEQVLLLHRRHHMSASDIVYSYTGSRPSNASIQQAIEAIEHFNLSAIRSSGISTL